MINFPFPTAPDREALAAAQACLQALGALDSAEALTDMGRAMAVLPLDPRPSRMILQVCPLPRLIHAPHILWQKYALQDHMMNLPVLQVALEACAARKAIPGLLASAVALAAISSVESPFVHIDSIQVRQFLHLDLMLLSTWPLRLRGCLFECIPQIARRVAGCMGRPRRGSLKRV